MQARRWTPFVIGLVVTMIIGAVASLAVTRTDAGRERILAITLNALGGALHPDSRLAVERLDGGLFTGAWAYGISLQDPGGETIVVADSARIRYRLASFFGGDILIDDLVVYGGEVLIYRLPTDSLWNYQRLLSDTVPSDTTGGPGRATVLHGLRLVDGTVTVRIPWEPADDLSPTERDAEIAAALAADSRIAVKEVTGGYLRTINARVADAGIEDLAVAPDERGGTYLRVVHAEAAVDLYRDVPLMVEGMTGELSLREGVVRYAAPEVRLPASLVATEGVLDMTGEEPAYDLTVEGSGVALRDLQWLYPAFPDEGMATFSMLIETSPGQLLLRATGLDFEATGTRVAGDFSLVLGDSLLFSDVSLRADPLDMGTVQRMLPVDLPVRGLTIGSAAVESAAS